MCFVFVWKALLTLSFHAAIALAPAISKSLRNMYALQVFPFVFVFWPVFMIFVVLAPISGTKNGHEWVLESMKSRFDKPNLRKTFVKHDGDIPGAQFGPEAAET